MPSDRSVEHEEGACRPWSSFDPARWQVGIDGGWAVALRTSWWHTPRSRNWEGAGKNRPGGMKVATCKVAHVAA